MMGIDKHKAINQLYRIPEKRLFLTAWLGGALGVLLAMKFFRHKTLHNSFRYGIPTIMIFTYSIAIIIQGFLIEYVVPGFLSLLDKAEEGGMLFFLLYPFILNRGTTGASMYWSSVWTVIVVILLLSITYYFLSKSISLPMRIGLILINLYSLLLMVYKCVIGLMNAGSLFKGIFLLALPLSIGFVRGFILGFFNAISEEISNEQGKGSVTPSIIESRAVDQRTTVNKSASEDEKDDLLFHEMPEDLLQNPTKYGLVPTGDMRLENTENPIRDEEKVDFPLFGATCYQRESLPAVCKVNMDKVFYKSGITVGCEMMYVKDLNNEREMEIRNISDLKTVHNHVAIGDELMFRVVEGRGTINERIRNIYLKIESHINLVKS